jgi:hypothetical protein
MPPHRPNEQSPSVPTCVCVCVCAGVYLSDCVCVCVRVCVWAARSAPEYVLEKRCDVGSDLWSFGCLIYALYHEGRSPVQSRDTVAAYAEAVRAVGSVSYAALPPALAGRHIHPTLNPRVCACMYACLRVCVCACMCARAFLSVCVCLCVCVRTH